MIEDEVEVFPGFDRNGRVPVYYQIASNIEHRIAIGEWAVGARLPSETDLAKQYGVSRMTIRQALGELENDEIVIRQRPTGTFVSRQPKKLAPTLSIPVNFLQGLNTMGHTSNIETVAVRVTPNTSDEIATELGIKNDDPLIEYIRHVTVNGSPVARVQSVVPCSKCPGLENFPLINNSIHSTIEEHFSFSIVQANHWIEAVKASAEDQEILGAKENSPILLLTSVYMDQNNQPIEHVLTYWLGDVMKLRLRSSVSDARIPSH